MARHIVSEHMLKNFFGFEYLIAPYTIAHLKLSQYLGSRASPRTRRAAAGLSHQHAGAHRPASQHAAAAAVARESERAQEIKEQPILVILGNPPYAGHSKNKGAWITGQIGKYREGFPELSKPAQGKWLQDDYVKFLRFAQWKMEQVSEGIVAVITNHSWLDNPTFKGMRKSLMETFDHAFVLDLHGNSKKKERAPDGSKDENVFDIEQGVAISIFVRRKGLERHGIAHADLWGERLDKYRALARASASDIPWTDVVPQAPDWLAKPIDVQGAKAYRELWALPAIFAPIGDPAPGIVTTHDEFAISYTASEARGKVGSLISTTSESEARRLFKLCSQDQWSYARAKEELPRLDLNATTVQITYRPFDERWTVWDRNVAVHRRDRLTTSMLKPNVSLISVRQVSLGVEDSPIYCFASERPVDNRVFLSSRGLAFQFPLYFYEGCLKADNLDSKFRDTLDRIYNNHCSSEELFGYIYASLYAPVYRARYAEFLRTDFPRIPFPARAEDFEALSRLGWALVEAHLLRPSLPRKGLAVYVGKGDDRVETVRRDPGDGMVWINATKGFRPVPAEVWEFRIGGYQVLDKYLKSRKGRVLGLDEIRHVARICDALAFTIDQMAKIDAAYRTAFPEQE